MAKGPKPQRRTVRYWLQQIHLWIGLILLLPLVMMGITGAVLVYAHDIEHLLGQGEPDVKTAGEWQSAARADRGGQGRRTASPAACRWRCAGRSKSVSPRPCACRVPAWRTNGRSSAAAQQGGQQQRRRSRAVSQAQGRVADAEPVCRQPADPDRSGVAAGPRNPAGDDGLGALLPRPARPYLHPRRTRPRDRGLARRGDARAGLLGPLSLVAPARPVEGRPSWSAARPRACG